jgi:putative exosortase-associated protein (TIGR04073 family)
MRKSLLFLACGGLAAVLSTGCSGPEKKLGRGLNNMTEFARGGELHRSVEQTYLWEGGDLAYTKGMIRGFNRSMTRTLVGMFEVLTFPFPGYEPYLRPGNSIYPDMSVNPVYPTASTPYFVSDPSWSPDANMGFGHGDIAPMIPGSKFRIFDY